MYRVARNWATRVTARTAPTTRVAVVRVKPSVSVSQSAKVSPTVVARTLITQKQIVISGTLFSTRRAVLVVGAWLLLMRCSLRGGP